MQNHDSKAPFDPRFCRNEREVESKLIVSCLLPALGYEINMWHQEKNWRHFRLDFLTTANGQTNSQVIIEAKHPDEELDNHVPQLENYMLKLQVDYGLLTNGREVRIYQRQTGQIHLKFECFGYGIEGKIAEIKALIGKDKLFAAQSQHIIQDNTTMKIIAVYHNKGGVGKTTTTVNLAAAFANRGKRVLIIDLDSQANTTFATGLINFGDEEKDDLKDHYIYHLLRYSERFSIPEVVRKSRFSTHDIDVIPSHILLMQHENELNQLDYSRIILVQKLQAVKDKYDIVLIDTPPSLNLYARIALITTDYLLIPSDLKPFANEGLENVKAFVSEINGFRKMFQRQSIEILGILPTKISSNNKFKEGTLVNRMKNVEERYQIEVLKDCIIFEREDLAKCIEQTLQVGELEMNDPRSIFDYKSSSKAVEEFEQLAAVIHQKIGFA